MDDTTSSPSGNTEFSPTVKRIMNTLTFIGLFNLCFTLVRTVIAAALISGAIVSYNQGDRNGSNIVAVVLALALVFTPFHLISRRITKEMLAELKRVGFDNTDKASIKLILTPSSKFGGIAIVMLSFLLILFVALGTPIAIISVLASHSFSQSALFTLTIAAFYLPSYIKATVKSKRKKSASTGNEKFPAT